MTDRSQLEGHLLRFFSTLTPLAPLLRRLSQEGLVVTVALRRSQARVLFELRRRPPRIVTGGAELPFTLGMAVSAEDLHSLLLGESTFVDAIGERRALLRGALGRLVAFFPVIELARPIYAAYLSRVGSDLAPVSASRLPHSPLRLRALGARALERNLRTALTAQGKALSSLPRGEILRLVEGLAEGLARWSLPELTVAPRIDGYGVGHPLAPPPPSPRRVAALDAARVGMVGLGHAVGSLALGAEVPVDAVTLLGHVARGIVEGERKSLILGTSERS